MELRRHIETLLLSNDCVIVPNLGGFMAHHINARYDENDGMFIPPYRTLGFNPSLTMSDPLLAQSYMELHDISYPEAIALINHEVSLLKHHLESEGRYEFTDIGTLYINASGNYEFESLPSGILTPYLYGLGALDMSHPNAALTSSGTSKAISFPVQPMGFMVPQSVSRTSKLATIMSTIDTPTPKEEKTISIKVSLLRNLAVTAVAAIALLLFARPVAPGEDGSYSSSSTEQAGMLATNSSSSLQEESVPSILSSLDKVSQKIKFSNEAGVIPTTGTYTIVLAYSLPLENAKAFLSDIQARGARKAVLFTYKSENVIAYGSYAEMSDAQLQLKSLLEDGCVSSGWIMEVK